MENIYTSLNDASVYTSKLDKGSTEIWYSKLDFSRDAMMGYEWLVEMGLVPNIKNLKKTHTLLGKIKEKDKNIIYSLMQGESWSPNGEAYSLIQKLKLTHTSMTVGDIIKVNNKYFMVDRFGFQELN